MTSLLLIGTGLVGGSFAKAAKAYGLFDRVVGVDRDAQALDRALDLGIIDAAEDVATANADAVCVAVPVAAIADLVDTATRYCDGPVFDVGSVKGSVIEALDPTPPNFVPCHPIAGSELQGPGAARADLFEGRTVVVTPVANTDDHAVDAVGGYWEAVGARVVKQTPEAHDECFARVSHLPHLLAFAFMEVAASAGSLALAGNGFRDFVRIAGADAAVWTDILKANAGYIRPHLDELIDSLGCFRNAMATGGDTLGRRIASAVAAKRAFDEASR